MVEKVEHKIIMKWNCCWILSIWIWCEFTGIHFEILATLKWNGGFKNKVRLRSWDWCCQWGVLRHLMCLKESSSPGPDGISPFTLRKCVLPLSLIFKKSWATFALPEDKLSSNNYRLISLISSVSKVLERVVCEQLLHFAFTHHIVPREQHGYF